MINYINGQWPTSLAILVWNFGFNGMAPKTLKFSWFFFFSSFSNSVTFSHIFEWLLLKCFLWQFFKQWVPPLHLLCTYKIFQFHFQFLNQINNHSNHYFLATLPNDFPYSQVNQLHLVFFIFLSYNLFKQPVCKCSAKTQ